MKTIFAIIAIFAVVSASNLDGKSMLSHFMKFIDQHNKAYTTVQEFEDKFKAFSENFINNDINLSLPFSPFMDLTKEEFRTRMGLNTEKLAEIKATTKSLHIKTFGTAPDEHDWRKLGAVTPVKDQQQCGSCWAFSAIGNVEGQQIIVNKKVYILSEQELVDCDREQDAGCNGGLMDLAFAYLIKNGAVQEKDYPYKGKDQRCKLKPSDVVVKVKSFNDISKNEDEIKEVLYTTGPLSVAVNANPFQTYQGGILRPTTRNCNPTELDHGVLAVGYGVASVNNELVKYWIIKNSWGASWGEDGFIRIERGTGACGVNTNVSTAVVESQ